MPTPSASFGQTLANAEQALTVALRRHLAERDTTPETWYVLQVITTYGPDLARQELSDRLERSRTLNPESVRELLARLEAEGLIRGDTEVELTAEGAALHRGLREHIAAPTARLLGRFPAEDIETTMRTLQAITERAEEELAADQPPAN
jgi:DNA-binding MarR family transcriptional regulator